LRDRLIILSGFISLNSLLHQLIRAHWLSRYLPIQLPNWQGIEEQAKRQTYYQ